MQAVILAAGLGTRMGDLTKDTPKPLLKIRDQTLLEHNLASMPDEIDEVIIVVGFLANQIESFIGNEFLGKKINYIYQKELKGTAHALAQCKGVLHDRFLVLMGDDLYYQKDLEKLIQKPLAILAWELENDDLKDDRQAIIKITDKGAVIDVIERQPAPKGTLVNAGAYVLNEDYFKYPLASAGTPPDEYGLPQTFMQMIKDGAQMTCVKALWWHKVANANDLNPNEANNPDQEQLW